MERAYEGSSTVNIFLGVFLCLFGLGITFFVSIFGKVFLEHGAGFWALIIFALFLALVSFLCGLNLIVYRKNFSIRVTDAEICIGNGVENWHFLKKDLTEVYIFSREDLVLKTKKNQVRVPVANYFQSDEDAENFVDELKEGFSLE